MFEPWNTVASVVVALATQTSLAFEAGRLAGMAQCQLAQAQSQQGVRQRGAQRERDFYRSPRQPETGNKAY